MVGQWKPIWMSLSRTTAAPVTSVPSLPLPHASYTDTQLLRSGKGFHSLLQDRREFAEGVAVGPCIRTPCLLHRYTIAQGYMVMDAPCHASCTLCISMSGHGCTSKAQGFQFRYSLHALVVRNCIQLSPPCEPRSCASQAPASGARPAASRSHSCRADVCEFALGRWRTVRHSQRSHSEFELLELGTCCPESGLGGLVEAVI